MSETWYEATRWSNKFAEVQVDRSTASSAWVRGRKRAIETEGMKMCRTLKEATDWKIEVLQREVDLAKKSLEYAVKKLEEAKRELGYEQ